MLDYTSHPCPPMSTLLNSREASRRAAVPFRTHIAKAQLWREPRARLDAAEGRFRPPRRNSHSSPLRRSLPQPFRRKAGGRCGKPPRIHAAVFQDRSWTRRERPQRRHVHRTCQIEGGPRSTTRPRLNQDNRMQRRCNGCNGFVPFLPDPVTGMHVVSGQKHDATKCNKSVPGGALESPRRKRRHENTPENTRAHSRNVVA